MLEMALQAALPLIKVTTTDAVNIADIISYYLPEGHVVTQLEEQHLANIDKPEMYKDDVYFYLLGANLGDYTELYENVAIAERCLIMVNPIDDSDAFFDAGIARLPKELLIRFLEDVAEGETIDKLVSTLGGLTLKDVSEVCRLAMTQYGELTTRAVVNIRRLYVNRLPGVTQVDTVYPFYQPDDQMSAWVAGDGVLFRYAGTPESLRPRGLLLSGEPGVGKSLGAKYIAAELAIPLYRIDLGAMMGKYVGESEGNLDQALSMVEQSEPCILMIDEVEKVLSTDDDTGVSCRMLSALLWWLQEHTSRVFTILTTNDVDALPKELYRPGRMDDVYELKGVEPEDQLSFMKNVVSHIGVHGINTSGLAKGCAKELSVRAYSHADLTKAVHQQIKAKLVDSLS